jgi:SRSO17 transposase
MDVHASPAVLPELEEFLASFQVRFRRPEGEHALERSLTGLRTELPNKNCATMAQAVPGTSEQRLQEFLPNMPWDHDDVHRQRVEQRIAEVPVGQGALLLDDTGCATQGTASLGVARQFSGPLGQVGHCQVAVTCGSSEARASWPVAVRLDLPQAWADDPARLRRARVPEDVTFPTTPPRALARLDHARAWGVPPRCVVAEAADGDTPHFWAGVEARRASYVVAVRSDFAVCLKRHGSPPVQRADQVLAALPRRLWRTIRWRHGTTGWLRKQCMALRCGRMTPEHQARIGWLLRERAARGPPEARKYSWSTLPAAATLAEVVDFAQRRHALEPCHAEATGALGWDQDQGRLWPGFHRHAVSAMLAYSFLLWQALRHRQHRPRRGRPREPFSPSARSTALDAASRASGGGPMATPPSATVVDDYGSVHGTLLTAVLTK